MTSIAKKRLLTKKYKKQILSSFKKTKSTQTTGSIFAERFEVVKETKLELHLKVSSDCSLDGHGICSSNLLSFRIETLN